MMGMEIGINYLAVLVAAVAAQFIGMFWYSPAGFGTQWMKLSNISKKDIAKAKKEGMTKSYVIGFIASLLMAYVLALFTSRGGLEGALYVAFWLWLGFVATTMINMVLWKNAPVKLYVIEVSFYLVTILVMAGIISSWP